jgi:hypothetical protein
MAEHNQSAQPQGTTPASVQPAAPAVAAPAIDAGTLQMLVTMLLTERQEQMEERQVRKAAYVAKEKQRRINAAFQLDQKNKGQSLCTHRKGGRSGFNPAFVNFAISHHTYVDATTVIRCLICGMRWKPGDTKQFLIRRGIQIPNHTEWGWADAHKAMKQTTNTATSSEMVMNYVAKVAEAPNMADPNAVEL